jgi:hypothetical protein
MMKKIGILSTPDDYIQILKSGYEKKQQLNFNPTLEEFLRVLSHLLTIAFTSVILVRIVTSSFHPLSSAEWLVYGVGIAQLATVLLLSESAGTYDAIIGLCSPIALAAILSIDRQSKSVITTRKIVLTLTYRAISGASAILILWLILIVAGSAFAKSHYAFVDFRKCHVQTSTDPRSFSVIQTDSSLIIRGINNTTGTDNAPNNITVTITIPNKPNANLQGFLSANQYQDAIASFERFPSGVARFKLSSSGSEILSGDLSELNKPKWINLQLDSKKEPTIELQVEKTTSDGHENNHNINFAIALEFLSDFPTKPIH